MVRLSILSIPNEGYSRNVSCTLNLISTLNFIFLDSIKMHIPYKAFLRPVHFKDKILYLQKSNVFLDDMKLYIVMLSTTLDYLSIYSVLSLYSSSLIHHTHLSSSNFKVQISINHVVHM